MKSSVLFITFLLFTSILGQNIPDNQLRTFSQADIVFVIDQATTPEDLINWMNTILPQLEEAMQALGLGPSLNSTFPGPLQNHYGLVLYGDESQPRNVLMQGNQFVPFNIFRDNFYTAFPSGPISTRPYHDGYLALQHALNYPWRQGAVHIVHLITPRWRHIIDNTIARDSLIERIRQLNIVLDVFTNTAFTIDTTQIQERRPLRFNLSRTFGLQFINQERTAFYITGGDVINPFGPPNVQNTVNIGRINAENSVFTVVDDYVELVEYAVQNCQNKTSISGSAFDLRIALTDIPEFNRAFILSRTLELSLLLNSLGIPPNQPTVCPLPTGSYINVEDSTFYINSSLQNLQQANQSCQLFGGILADINERNVNIISGLAASNNINNSSAIWVNSWNMHTYGGTPLVLIGNNVMVKDNTNELLPSVCQIKPADQRCISFILE